MKASQHVKPQIYQQYQQTHTHVQSFGPIPQARLKPNKSLLDKYSFQDNDISKTSEIISQMSQINPKQQQEDWLRLSIKEITTIGKELIQTFYLAVKYFVEYQDRNQPNFDKNKTSSKAKQTLNQVKVVKSKLVYGSILQNEHKNLILNLKCKKPQIVAKEFSKPTLTRIEFSIMRIFEAKHQAFQMAKYTIENPNKNNEYEINFVERQVQKVEKPKPVAAMIFEINNAINQELEGNDNTDSSGQSQDQEEYVSEHLQEEQDKNNVYNYTLGKPQKTQANKKDFNNKNDTHTNIFQNESQQDNEQNLSSHQNLTSEQNNSHINSPKQNNQEIIQKLNELSHIIDANLYKSKNQDQAYKNYLEETSNMIENFQNEEKQSDIDIDIGQQKSIKNTNQNMENGVNQIQGFQSKKKDTQKKSQQTRQVTQQSYTKENVFELDDSNVLGDRYNYVSRIQNTQIATDQFNQEIRVNNSNTQGGQRYDYVSRVENSNFLEGNDLNDISSISVGFQNSRVFEGKKSNISKKEPFFQFKANQKKQSKNKSTTNMKQEFNLSQLDSSNIRYDYNENQNDVSNVEETKNMQQLINQIEKIEKQWYEKRVLNRKNQEFKKDTEDEEKDQINKPFDLVKYPDDVMDIELKNFNIKFTEQTFYKKLFHSLKIKHSNHVKKQQINPHSRSSIPPNYIVYLVANQLDDQNMNQQPQQSSRIQITIPSYQITKLLELDTMEIKNIPNQDQNSPSSSKHQQKQIIKAFQKQLKSKVMKLKINKSIRNDKHPPNEKKKARIIQIALQQEYENLPHIDLQGKNKDLEQNRISLIGMYTLPIFAQDQKDSQTSFYQNVSVQPLAIQMYDTKTGAQQGRLKFELKKSKIDQGIQTLEPLQDVDGQNQQNHHNIHDAEQQQDLARPIDKDFHEQDFDLSNQVNYENKKSEKYLQVNQVYTQQHPINAKSKHKRSEQQQNSQTNSFPPIPFKSQQLPLPLNTQLNINQSQQNKQSIKNLQLQNRQSLHNLVPGKEGFAPPKKVKTEVKLSYQKTDQDVLASLQKKRPKSINICKGVINVNKDIDLVGRIIKNHSNPHMEIDPLTGQENNHLNLKNLSRVKNKSQVNRQLQVSPSRKNPVYVTSPSSIHQNVSPQSQTSYIMMKQQFLATANMLASIKNKAQNFVNKIQSERKIHTPDPVLSDKQEWKEFDSNAQSNSTHPLLIENKAIHLEINSYVINEAIMSNKKKSRNQPYTDQIQLTPLSVHNNPKINYFPSRKSSVNKSRNSKNSQTAFQNGKKQFNKSIEVEQQSPKPKFLNYEKLKRSNGSILFIEDKNYKIRQKSKKPLIYKEQSQYQFTQEDDREGKDLKRSLGIGAFKASHKNSNRKVYGMDYPSDYSNELESSIINPIQQNRTKKRQSQISTYSSQQVIEIKLFAIKIKLLLLPLLAKNQKMPIEHLQKGKQYFILVYSDYGKQSANGLTENLIKPITKKCFRKNQSKDNELMVSFSNKNSANEIDSSDYLLFRGTQTSKFIFQLYQSPYLPATSNELAQGKHSPTSLEHINLITLSPPHKKSAGQPFASLSVTFIQLLAQQQSIKSFSQNPLALDLITYTNFLYKNQKIVGKININYNIEISKTKNISRQLPQSKINHKSRRQIIEGFIEDQPQNDKRSIQKEDEFKTIRSQSSITKKLIPRLKQKVSLQQQLHLPQRNKFSDNKRQNKADPLEILKRKLPKSFKSQEKGKSHSQSYSIRLNRPYYTPMSRGKGNQLLKRLNSSSSVNSRGDIGLQRKHQQSAFSSNHFEGEPIIPQSPIRNNQAELMKLRQKKQEQKIKRLKAYQATSHIQQPFQKVEQTRISQKRVYEGGNIKFGKSSRFSSGESQQMISRRGSKKQFPGPGHYEAKSIFDRHTVKEL